MAFGVTSISLKCETGTQLFARLESRPSISNLEPTLFSSVSSTDIIEISGEAGSGKTELLYHFIIRCIFPISWKGLLLNGLDAGVLFIDNDFHFNLFRLISILEKRIFLAKKVNDTNVTEEEVSIFVTERLRLLYVVKCSNSEQFIITLYSLENLLSSNNKISCIMIDSISSFYWIDRMNAMQQLKKLDEHHDQFMSALIKLLKSYSLPLFVTKQNLTKKEEYNSSEDYEFMGRHWEKLVTCRLKLSLEQVESDRTIFNLSIASKTEKEDKKCRIIDSGMEF